MRRAWLIIFILCLVGQSYGQAWSGIIDSSRAIDWTGVGIPGGIPSRTTVCNPLIDGNTVDPSGDVTGATDTSVINTAIQNCTANQVVKLAPGTFYTLGFSFGFPSAKNNVTVRGAGTNSTKIIVLGPLASGCGSPAYICIQGNSNTGNTNAGSTSWTAGYAQGASVITVGSTTGLSTTLGASGNIIILDQRNDTIGICPLSGGTGNCSGQVGVHEVGTTVTITTTIPHGFTAGQCVGIGNIPVVGYDSADNPLLSCNGKSAWFLITATPSSTQFQYTVTNSGLADSGDTGGTFAPSAMVDNGGITTTEIQGAVLGQNANGERSCPDASNSLCATGESSVRNQLEFKRVLAICTVGNEDGRCSGPNQVVIDPPVESTNWRSGQAPGVWWTGNYAIGDGVEDLTLDYSSEAYDSTTNNFVFKNAYESWLRNVRSISGNQSHTEVFYSARINIQDNYFYGSKGGASQSYGVLAFINSDSLIQNNICQRVNACILQGDSWGSVFGYNNAYDNSHADALLHPLMSLNHGFGKMLLAEGNNTPGIELDDTHGVSPQVTLFRNGLRGQDSTPTVSNGSFSFFDAEFSRAINVVGNVLGTSSHQNAYQCGYWGGCSAIAPVYVIGNQDGGFTMSEDAVTRDSLLRWANYDVVTGGTRFCGNSSSPGWGTTCQGVTSATYVSGGTIIGSAGSRCGVTFTGGAGTGAAGTIYLSATNTISGAITVVSPGMNFTSAPTSATLVSGVSPWAATCSGTITVSSSIGGVSEVPTSGIAFVSGNSVPACHDITCLATFKSFYLPAQPSWWSTAWGTPKWPAIGPDVSGGNNTGDTSGHSDKIPAQLAFENTSIDSGYQLLNTVTGGSWSGGVATLTGVFSARTWDTIQVTNAAGYNGQYKLTSSDTPSAPGKFCNSSAVCTNTQGPVLVASAGTGPVAGLYHVRITYVNATGESLASHRSNITTSGGNLTITVYPPALSDGVAGNTTGWNVYITAASGDYYFKQNNLPVAFDGTTPFVQSVVINTSGVGIPLVPTARGTQVAYSLTANPGVVFPIANGVVAYPNVRAFDANTSYGISGSTPTPPTGLTVVVK